ncbi:MAG: glycosyltransferase, partial [Bacteroidota bacterium]|nr:glycosyltransferase [Bacteroidota bacterium]
YAVIRNLPRLTQIPETGEKPEKWIIYQGSVNEGRCFEQLIPAMKQVPAKLVICGKGNFYEQTQALVKKNGLEEKVIFTGYLSPAVLAQKTSEAYIGITLFERQGMNQYYSLANRFFDYCMAGIPQVCVNYPEYAAINARFQIASLIADTEPETIARSLNNLLSNDVVYQQIRSECLKARQLFNWEMEVQTLIKFYRNL